MPITSTLANWQVLFLKPRTEKKVAEVCAVYAIPHYLPLRTVSSVRQRRKITVSLPLFPGYLFVALTPETRKPVLETNHVVRFLKPQSAIRLLRDLVQIRRALSLTPDLKPVVPLKQGQRVRIISGPLQGSEGVVSKITHSMRVILSVDLIGMAVAVTAARNDVEPVR